MAETTRNRSAAIEPPASHSTVVRLTPAIALDYEARGVFPEVRLDTPVGTVPKPQEIEVSQDAAVAMLADVSVRRDQLRQIGRWRGGVAGAWMTWTGQLEWAATSAEDQAHELDLQAAAKSLCKGADERADQWRAALTGAAKKLSESDVRGFYLERMRADLGKPEYLSEHRIGPDWRRKLLAAIEELQEIEIEEDLSEKDILGRGKAAALDVVRLVDRLRRFRRIGDAPECRARR